MPIPDFQTVMRPLLESHGDGKEHVSHDLINSLADQFNLSEEERREMYQAAVRDFSTIESDGQRHRTQAGLLTSPRSAISVITQRGVEALQSHPECVA